jgi:AcrR family transcriptional regulator
VEHLCSNGNVSDGTRRAILDTAAAVLGRHSGASLADIASAAGVGRTTVHRHFATRTDLLHALAMDSLERVEQALTAARPDADEPLAVIVERVATALLPLADEMHFLGAGAQVWDLPDLVERWYDVSRPLEDTVRRAQRTGEVRPDLPVAWVVDLFVAAVFAASDGITDGRIARRDAVPLVVGTLLDGVSTAAGTATRSRS